MRIAIASDDGTRVAPHTGRCQGFAVFEVAGQSATLREHRANTYSAHARGECQGTQSPPGPGGHGSHGALIDALADCQVLVTRGLGPRLVADLAKRGIDAYVCQVDSVDEAARLYAQGQLPRVTAPRCGCHS